MSDLEQTQSETKPEERSLGLACHLLALAGLVVPFGNILGPLIMWLSRKMKVPLSMTKARKH